VLLLSVPYALQAADAEMQRQLPSAFVLAAPSAGAGKSHLAQAIGQADKPLSNYPTGLSRALSRDPQTAR
jgi:chromosomal replication initiation ATPase DnaA